MNRLIRPIAPAAALLFALSGRAMAAGTGMPWETGIEAIFNSLTGPIIGWVAVIVIILAGLALAFGNLEGGAKKIVFVVIGIGVVAGAPALAASLGIVGGAMM